MGLADVRAGAFGKSLQPESSQKLAGRIYFLHLNERVYVMNDFLRLHSFLEPKLYTTKKRVKHRLSKRYSNKAKLTR